MQPTRNSIAAVSLILCLVVGVPTRASELSAPAPETAVTAPIIVIGFVGGFVKHDNTIHTTVQLAANLRRDYPSGVHVKVFENHRAEVAHAEIVRLLDVDRNGTLSPEEKKNARIIIYGHSWGASETVTLARQLEREGIPVMLTVQVDSVAKHGENDKVMPANVGEAANFYQLDGFLHGESAIRAADPARTHILGNFRFNYKEKPIRCDQYPWYYRAFMKSHIEIECDTKVWDQVESLIKSHLPKKK